jgi:two-component system sensor histidine kinase UhpB
MSQPERRTRDGEERITDLLGRLITAQEAERARIARDLHDGVCQDVAAIGVDLSHLRRHGGEMARQEFEAAVVSIERRTGAVAETLRRLSHGLHPTVLKHVGLVAALQSHCAEIERQYHLDVTFFASGAVEPVGAPVALGLFRIAQEALRNTARHAHARHVTLSLTRGVRCLSMSVTDDGAGFDVGALRNSGGGLGLVSIEERVRLMQGRVVIRSERDGGTVVDVCVPTPGEGEGEREAE